MGDKQWDLPERVGVLVWYYNDLIIVGVSCAVLVGKIHQLYPYYSVSQLLFKFFFIYS
jgi:poly(A) polymerase Pap1